MTDRAKNHIKERGTPPEDLEQAFLVREALANLAIARAQKKERTFTPSDEGVDEEVTSLDPRLSGARTFWELRDALVAVGKGGAYTDEGLEL